MARCRWFPPRLFVVEKSTTGIHVVSAFVSAFLNAPHQEDESKDRGGLLFPPSPFPALSKLHPPPHGSPSRRRKTDEGVVRGGLRSFHYFSRNAISGIIELGQLAGELSAERLLPNWSFVKDTLPVWKAVLYAMAIRLAGGWKASISSAKLVIWKPSPGCGWRGLYGSNLINVKIVESYERERDNFENMRICDIISMISIPSLEQIFLAKLFSFNSLRTYFFRTMDWNWIRKENERTKWEAKYRKVSEVPEVFFLLLTIFCFPRLILSSLYHLPLYPQSCTSRHGT